MHESFRKFSSFMKLDGTNFVAWMKSGDQKESFFSGVEI